MPSALKEARGKVKTGTGQREEPLQQPEATGPRELVAAALDWWRDAGVDCAFVDEPAGWLAQPQAATPARPDKAPVEARGAGAKAVDVPQRIGGDPAKWPQTLEDFARWWLTDPSLDPAPPSRRVPPMGIQDAELMILVGSPEPQDDTILLSGSAGRLLDGMLAAMGLSRDRIYLAAALPSASPAPDWNALADSGLDAVVRHHIALVRPRRLLVLGRSVASALLGHDPAKNAQTLHPFNHEGRELPVLAGFDLETMLVRPNAKAGVWKSWLEWTGSETR